MGKHIKLKSPKQPSSEAVPPAGQQLAESAALLQSLQQAIAASIGSGEGTPALAREAANVARAVAIVTKAQQDEEEATRKRFAKLTDRERDELVVEYLRGRPKKVRQEAAETLQATLKGKEAA